MISVEYSSDFIRIFKKFNSARAYEVRERIEEFRNPKNHQRLKVHKLKGRMKDLCAFLVNYKDRIIFEWSKDKKTTYLIDIGDHSVYE
jgi:mRNA-degrading endonuclease YafQ of YafQ-DinJ toxin-antitoxin module